MSIANLLVAENERKALAACDVKKTSLNGSINAVSHGPRPPKKRVAPPVPVAPVTGAAQPTPTGTATTSKAMTTPKVAGAKTPEALGAPTLGQSASALPTPSQTPPIQAEPLPTPPRVETPPAPSPRADTPPADDDYVMGDDAKDPTYAGVLPDPDPAPKSIPEEGLPANVQPRAESHNASSPAPVPIVYHINRARNPGRRLPHKLPPPAAIRRVTFGGETIRMFSPTHKRAASVDSDDEGHHRARARARTGTPPLEHNTLDDDAPATRENTPIPEDEVQQLRRRRQDLVDLFTKAGRQQLPPPPTTPERGPSTPVAPGAPISPTIPLLSP